jgi:hypothetical protein
MTDYYDQEKQRGKRIWPAMRQGFVALYTYPRLVFVFWGSSLLLALLAALPLRTLLLVEAADSLMVKDLIAGFDYTFLNDFFQNYGAGFTPILQQSVLLLGVQYLLLVFLVGGLVKVLWERPASGFRAVFWGGAAQYFWRMLRLTLFFLLLHGLVLAVFLFLYFQVTHGLSPKVLDSEAIITSSLLWLVPLYVLVAAIPFMWQDYAKVLLVKTEPRFIWSAVGRSGLFLLRNFRSTYLLYLLNLGMVLLVIIVNYFLTSAWPIASSTGILLAFLGSQVFALVRLALKVVNQGSVVAFYGEESDG